MKAILSILTCLFCLANARAGESDIVTHLKLNESGNTLSAPSVTSKSGTSFQISIATPVDLTERDLPVGAILLGIATLNQGLVDYELTLIIRELDTKRNEAELKLRAYNTKEYILTGRAKIGTDTRIKVSDKKFFILKFSNSE